MSRLNGKRGGEGLEENRSCESLSKRTAKLIATKKIGEDLAREDQETSSSTVANKTSSSKGNCDEGRGKTRAVKTRKGKRYAVDKQEEQVNSQETRISANSKSSEAKGPGGKVKENSVMKNSGQRKRKNIEVDPRNNSAAATCDILPLKKRRIDEKTIEEGCELLKQGLPNKIVGEKLNVPAHTVKYWRCMYLTVEDREMLKKKPNPKRIERKIEGTLYYSKEKITQVCELLKQGASMSKISREFGIHPVTIRKWKLKYIFRDFPLVPKLKKEQTRMQVYEFLKQGHSIQSIAKQLGVGPETVDRWRYKLVPESEGTFKINSDNTDNNKILEVCRKLIQDYSMTAVSKITGIPYKRVITWNYKYLSERQDETEGRWSGYIMLEACQQLQRGISADIVAKELNVSVNLVRKWETENAVILRTEPQGGRKYDKEFIRNVCEQLQQGKTVKSIAGELNVHPHSVRGWKERYCTGKVPEPKDGMKYKKETILEACKLLKKGKSLTNVARKLKIDFRMVHSWRVKYLENRAFGPESNNYFQFNRKIPKCDKKMIREGCKLLKKGYSAEKVGRILKVSGTTVRNWSRKSIRKENEQPKPRRKFDIRIVRQVCKRLQRGEKIGDLSHEFKVDKQTIYKWKHNSHVVDSKIKEFLRTEKIRKKGIDDVKLKSKCSVVLLRNSKIDELGRKVASDFSAKNHQPAKKSHSGRTKVFVPFRKVHISNMVKLQLVKMIEDDGVSIATLSKELNVNVNNVVDTQPRIVEEINDQVPQT